MFKEYEKTKSVGMAGRPSMERFVFIKKKYIIYIYSSLYN